MRILFDARGVRDQSDGLSNYVRHILSALLRIDGENEYVVLVGPTLMDEFSQGRWQARPNLRLVMTRCPFMGLAQQVQIPWLVGRLAPATLYHYPHFDMPLLAHPCSVVTIHDLNHVNFSAYFDSHKRLKQSYSFCTTALSVRRARHIFAVSQTTKTQLLVKFPWLDPQKISVTYEGPGAGFTTPPYPDRVAEFRRKFDLGEARYILYVGTDRTHKNLGRLLEAYQRLRQGGQVSQRLLLVGSLRQDGDVARMITQLGLAPFVRQLGHVADEELPLVYRVADAFAFCSLSEGFGIPLLEAMASEVPIVTSNFGAMAEVAGDGAQLVDPFSAASIAEGLHRVLTSETLRAELIAKGRKRSQRFCWEETARQTLAVYRKAGADGMHAP